MYARNGCRRKREGGNKEVYARNGRRRKWDDRVEIRGRHDEGTQCTTKRLSLVRHLIDAPYALSSLPRCYAVLRHVGGGADSSALSLVTAAVLSGVQSGLAGDLGPLAKQMGCVEKWGVMMLGINE